MSVYTRIVLAAATTAAALHPQLARADVVTDWNETAVQATLAPPNAVIQSRVLAAVHVAIHEALQGAGALQSAERDAAAAAAAHGVLSRLTAGQGELLDAALKRALGTVPGGRGKTDAITLGSQTAERIVAQRRADGADAKVTFTPSAGPGRWQPTPPGGTPAILAQFGAVKPFVLDPAARFPLAGPPAPGTPAFSRDLDEVRAVGARHSGTRTADQTAAAIFWTVQTLVPWNAAARAAAAAHGNTREENARLFAALNVACFDAHIATFEAKYRFQNWRPVTAIRARAATPGSPDATWEPLLVTPPHPDYPSSHATCSGAAEAVLRGFFGSDSVAVTVIYPPIFGVSRTFASFSEMGKEVDNARVWGGIHFRTADTDGHDLGRRVGELVLARFAAPVKAPVTATTGRD